jgi:hypothetical protein
MDRQVEHFLGRAQFDAQLRQCLARAGRLLQCFDPDFALWGLEGSEAEALLRHFLAGKGRIELVAHDNDWLARECPRFLRLLADYGASIECRITPHHLRQLTDSFCIADGKHIVRRFHCDHLRGETVFDGPADTMVSAERFAQIWEESRPGLHAGTTGL